MRRHYDYVLIDSRTGLSDIADICTVQMPDVLMVCFTLSDQSGEKEKADAGRVLAQVRFDGLPSGLRGDELAAYWGSFDNADDPQEVRRFFPGGSGHVMVTFRNQAWSAHAESVEHLRRRAQGLGRKDADRVAEAVGDLPLAVEVAAAWLAETGTPVATYVTQLNDQTTKALAVTRVPDYPRPVEATWNVSIRRLREQSPAAVRLLQLCAFFAAEPISMNLFYSDPMIRALVRYDADLRDKFMLDRVRYLWRRGEFEHARPLGQQLGDM